jgi:Mg-chelatase subunit ChlD
VAPRPPAKDDDQQQARAGVLTAGEWSDLGHWSDWLRLTGGNGRWGDSVAQWGFRGWQKVTVEVKSEGKKVTDAFVTLSSGQGSVLWQAKTNNEGQAVLFVKQQQGQTKPALHIAVQSSGETGEYDNVDLANPLPVVVELKRPVQQQTNVADIMFVMDTTGSMGDELEYIKTELKNVITRIEDANGENGNKLRTRVSTNFYRDQGDDYVVRPFPFTEDVNEAERAIGKQRAEGGGDYPEAVEQALDDAINNHKWSERARARLLFLVLDAPPHHTDAIVSKIQTEMAQAASAGIRIIPVASSGVNKDTEFLLRSMAIATGGTYVFLTDHSGVGNSHIEPTIGSYQVEHLNDLLVQIATRYIRTPANS